jgi:hypothetical protein
LNTPSVVARFYWISITQISAMSYSISTLLIRNLCDVFGENDPARRRAAVDEIFTEDCVFYEPRGVYRGRVKWVAGRRGEAPVYAGTDFIIVRDGRIAAVYLFFDKFP